MRIIFALLLATLFSLHARAVVSIEDRQGIQIKTSALHFTDDHGTPVVFDQYFHQKRPVLLAFVYFECPGACTILLDGVVAGLKRLVIEPGKSFEVVVVSIDPTETATLAEKKKQTYYDKFLEGPEVERRLHTENGWHFLTGTEADIASLTSQVGFQYERDANGVYIHPSALFVFDQDAVLSSTLMGVTFPKKDLNTALLAAASGRRGIVQRFNYICYAYLPHVGWLDRPVRWALLLGGILFLALFVLVLKFRPNHVIRKEIQ